MIEHDKEEGPFTAPSGTPREEETTESKRQTPATGYRGG